MDYINRLISAGMDKENANEIISWFSMYSSEELLDVYVNLYEMRNDVLNCAEGACS